MAMNIDLKQRAAARRPRVSMTPEVDFVRIRFAGDSGDGIQLTGTRLAAATAHFGNDFATFPDYPAEIRAPLGTTYGVSAYSINIGQTEVLTAGDNPDVLVALNPAALKVNIGDVREAGPDHRRRGRLQRQEPAQGRLSRQSAGRRHASPSSACCASTSPI
jgi:2-oxoglutarate/2-oxoacid ferredoxin oxidoreductase subunit alpha